MSKTAFALLRTNDKTIPISDSFIIGRSDACNLILNNQTISKSHCIIERNKDNKIILRDLNTINGTYVNDKKVKEGNLL